MQRIILAGLVILVFVVALGVVALSQKSRPAMPRDADHIRRSNDECQACHRYNDGVSPLPASHPVQKGCQSCHALAES